jgi:DNA-binding MarR family transcriptional regulator/N-acetylglutamate synthase-like GNAT family acetyltransferase
MASTSGPLDGRGKASMGKDAGSQVEAVRRFNRFYTSRIGILAGGPGGGGFSLPEARLLFEIAHWSGAPPGPAASDLARALDLDAGYVSRLLKALERRGVLSRRVAERDARRALLALTAIGRRAFAALEAEARRSVSGLLEPLDDAARAELVASMRTIEALLQSGAAVGGAAVELRAPRPGDAGWVVSRHGAIYAREFGWNVEFEALVAEIVARVVRRFDPAREAWWIAERAGRPVGSVCLVRKSARVAQLRLLFVDPAARGAGVGRILVDACTGFARAHGYRRIELWTHANLEAARHIYATAGYRLLDATPYRAFGCDLVSENWALDLG